MPLRKKGNGRSLHVSDFIVEEFGRLHLSEEQIQEQRTLPLSQQLKAFDARVIIYPGKNFDGWWNAERLLAQVKIAVPIFEKLYPGCIGEWNFDHSTGHTAFSAELSPVMHCIRPTHLLMESAHHCFR